MKLTRTKERAWRGLVEFVVITMSILLAFSLDRWWDVRKDHGDEQKLLIALVEEFEATAQELRDSWDRHETRRAAAEALALVDLGTLGQITADSATSLWNYATKPETADPPQGTLTAVIANGTLTLIRNGSLQSHLAGWEARLADYNHTERNLADYILFEFIPWMALQGPLPYGSQSPLNAAFLSVPTKNHLNRIVLVSEVALGENEALQDEVNEILTLLRQESGWD